MAIGCFQLEKAQEVGNWVPVVLHARQSFKYICTAVVHAFHSSFQTATRKEGSSPPPPAACMIFASETDIQSRSATSQPVVNNFLDSRPHFRCNSSTLAYHYSNHLPPIASSEPHWDRVFLGRITEVILRATNPPLGCHRIRGSDNDAHDILPGHSGDYVV